MGKPNPLGGGTKVVPKQNLLKRIKPAAKQNLYSRMVNSPIFERNTK